MIYFIATLLIVFLCGMAAVVAYFLDMELWEEKFTRMQRVRGEVVFILFASAFIAVAAIYLYSGVCP